MNGALPKIYTGQEGEYEKHAILSDIHGFHVDVHALSVTLAALNNCPLDVLHLNGDTLDVPNLMGENKHKFSIDDEDISLAEEIEFTYEHILKPLRKAVGKKTRIMFRLGNHEARLIRIDAGNRRGLRELLEAANKQSCSPTDFAKLLRFDELGIELDRGVEKENYKTDTSFIQKKHDRGTVTHGWLTNANRCKKYIEIFHSSGTTGHTHAMKSEIIPWVDGNLGWYESGCLCKKTGVGFFPLGKPSLWVHGFITMWRNKYDGTMFWNQHKIEDYTLEFRGKIYSSHPNA